jgi:S1-C subfamily serine protease
LFDLGKGAKVTTASNPVFSDADVPGLAKASDESAKLAASVMPSIVRVDVGAEAIVAQRDIFGFLRGFRPEIVNAGLGSGVIVSKEGHVVTNVHVIQGAQRIRVTTSDRKPHDAEVIGVDADLDIAVLRIKDGGNYQPLAFADSERVRVGEMVFALGCPFGLEFTVSRGIVSATQRRFSDAGNDYIQTDTVINFGNSGGPLVNHRGEIVGINRSIYTGDQNVHAWQGIGLAIPANDAREAFEAITGKRARAEGYLGIDVQMIIMERQGRVAYGARVNNVMPGSPAALAGLQAGDIIAQFNGAVLSTENELLNLIRRAKVGQTVTLVVLRADQEVTLKAQIQPRPVVR